MTPEFPDTTWKIEDTVVVTVPAWPVEHFYVLALYCGDATTGWPENIKWRGGITPKGLCWCKDNMIGRVVVGSVQQSLTDNNRWPVLGFEKTVDAVKFKLTCL